MVEIISSEQTQAFTITEASGVGQARRAGADLARRLGLGETQVGKLALIVTEAASNLVKHAGAGTLVVRELANNDQRGVEILALDRGPGIRQLGESLRDGFSTAGGAGTGLGAIRRLASRFDLYSIPGAGTALLAELWSDRLPQVPAGSLELGAVSLPYPGEAVSGDGWAAWLDGARGSIILADGLGHGPGAADAALEAITAFRKSWQESPAELLQTIHGALRKTRGAAIAIAALDLNALALTYAGIGNISAMMLAADRRRTMVSHNGIVGHQAHKFNQLSYPWMDHPLLILHSDGLNSHWNLAQYPGLAQHYPSLIAGVLCRDASRGRDDVTVLVVRQT